MSQNSILKTSLLALSLLLTAPVFAAEDAASMHEVYQAADAGKFTEAQAMMDKVLKEHPNSAKAHYVESELLAKQGQFAAAKTELNKAENLQPGLPFAKPEAVQKLKSLIGVTHSSMQATTSYQAAATPASTGGFSSSFLWLGIGLIVFIFFVVRLMNRRNQNPVVIPANQYAGYGSNGNMQPGGSWGSAPPMQPTGGMGSGIMSGLATGAAVGAGMVAGEALMHHFTDGDRSGAYAAELPPTNNTWNPSSDDMGGSDFGIADNSSWDDSSSSGGDDWS